MEYITQKMRKISFILSFLGLITVTGASAQSLSRVTYGVDIGSGFGDKVFTPSINYFQNLTFGNFRYVGIGWTGRFAGTIVNDPILKTLGTPGVPDEVSLRRSAVYSAAFGLTINFDFEHIEFGANVDLLNLSMGKTSQVLYKIADLANATDSSAMYHNELVRAFPQMANFLPAATRRSNGNSEAYIRLWINQEFGIKLGYQIQNVVYSTEDPLNNAQRRFVAQYGMPFAALSFHIQN